MFGNIGIPENAKIIMPTPLKNDKTVIFAFGIVFKSFV